MFYVPFFLVFEPARTRFDPVREVAEKVLRNKHNLPVLFACPFDALLDFWFITTQVLSGIVVNFCRVRRWIVRWNGDGKGEDAAQLVF